MWKWILVYIAGMNVTGFFLMGLDKKRARAHAWRIPEKTLFLCSLIGGSVGTWAGMYAFRHKTKHWYFVVGMPLVLFLQLAAFTYLWRLYHI